jgi:hypothetical protein
MAFDSNEAKSIFTSKTFWGSVIALVALVFPMAFAKLGFTDQGALADKIVGGMGTLLAIYGRLAATQPATLTGK